MGKKLQETLPITTEEPERISLAVKAGPYVYEISENEEIYKVAADNKENYFGITMHHTGQIFITPGLPSGIKYETIFHEIMHVAKQMSGLQFGFKDEDMELEIEERFVAALSPALYTILLENPELVTTLFGSSEE